MSEREKRKKEKTDKWLFGEKKVWAKVLLLATKVQKYCYFGNIVKCKLVYYEVYFFLNYIANELQTKFTALITPCRNS